MNAIAAVSLGWGLGRGGEMLFHISEDLRRFRALTTGGTILMGRKTLDSLPGGKPLPNRRSVVLTRDRSFTREGVEVVHSPEEALALLANEDPETVWLCGGGEVYTLLLPYCRLCYLTRIYAAPESDAFFPDLDKLSQWQLFREEPIRSDGELDFQFVEYVNRESR